MTESHIIKEHNHGAFCIWKNKVVKADKLEVWKPIRGFEHRYWISNMGRILSAGRQMIARDGYKRNYPDKLLKLTPKPLGYTCARLYKDGGTEYEEHLVHRLVATHFIPNPEQLPVVNHINEIRHDNQFFNLEWVTVQANVTHNDCHLRAAENRRKAVYQLTEKGHLVKEWKSVDEAHAAGYYNKSIRKVCYGTLRKHRGYIWTYNKPEIGESGQSGF
ncbi:NUMOD4 domain-containing protein [Salinimicrobium soli]|uniref:NUMOD4 domain-containing protein n=1 Tax=Salinimicrobium soli TaxID=1254399 RepID=UPI003AAB3AC5